MASKKSVTKNDVDIQKLRDEGNWKRLIELAESGRLGANDQLGTLLLGEAKLEQFVEEQQPSEFGNGNIKAKAGLVEAKQLLGQSAGKEGSRSTGSMDAQLLLAKLHFISGEYKEALQYLTDAGLDQLTEKPLPIRGLKIVAESFAVQALSLEKSLHTKVGKVKQDAEQQLIKSMETAGDITLLYLQELDKLQGQSNWSIATSGSNSPLPPANDQRIGVLLETALVRGPLMYLKNHKWQEAINRYRTILRAIESSATQTIRLNLARQLAELLLRKTCQGNYQAITSKNPEFHWKPKHYTGSTLFCPRDANEEVFLLLLISEAMAVRDAVLSQSPEFREQRKASMRNASAVYDLLTLCCALHDQPGMICESLERALKFSFDDPHIWSQFAHSLIASGKFQKAVRVLKEVSRLLPDDPVPCLVASKVCLENLKNIDEGYDLAEKAISIAKVHHTKLLSRCYLLRAIACFIKSRQNRIQPLKQSWMSKCMESLRDSSELDPSDHLVHFYLSLSYAMRRQIPQALAEVRTALRLRGEHLPSLLLLSLLLSTWAASNSQAPNSPTGEDSEDSKANNYQGALALIEATLEEYPQNFDLLYVKALLEERCHGGETALVTAKHMLALWKSYYEDSSSGFNNDATITNNTFTNNYDSRSVALSAVSAPYANDLNERESSIYAQSVAAARAEQALSDVTSSLCSNVTRPGVQQAWHVQLRIWLLIGELYVRLGKCDEAFACAQEAALLSPVSHHVMYLRGLIHEQKNEFAEAKTYFKNATSLSPFHMPSLQHLGIVLHYLGSNRLAEKTLRESVRLDPTSENSWFYLGKVLEAMDEYEKACDCMATALQVQTTSPVVPFSAVPICFD